MRKVTTGKEDKTAVVLRRVRRMMLKTEPRDGRIFKASDPQSGPQRLRCFGCLEPFAEDLEGRKDGRSGDQTSPLDRKSRSICDMVEIDLKVRQHLRWIRSRFDHRFVIFLTL